MTPDQFTIKEEQIDVGDNHQIYTQLWGNNKASETVVFLHGGPGGGCSDGQKDYFNPKVHKVLFFDQRGSGKSTPYGSITNNTTQDLISDINKITDHYGIKKFILTGGSWGSTLALAYAIENPDRLLKLIIRGIFTSSKEEIDFLYKGKFSNFFPEVWDEFVASAPDEYKSDPFSYHSTKILGDNKEEAKKSAYAYNNLISAIISLDDRTRPTDFNDFDPAQITIECYYTINNCFLEDNYILENAHKINVPVEIIQGRYDVICPPINAYKLAKKLPNCRVQLTTAGHSGHDRASWDVITAVLAS